VKLRVTRRHYPAVVRLVLAAATVLVVVALAIVVGRELLDGESDFSRNPIPFTGDFETGSVSQWTWGAQCANTSSNQLLFTRGTVTVQSEIVAEGKYAARFDLPASPSDKSACETLARRPIGIGTNDYYGMMVRFPPEWREPSRVWWGLAIAQLNYQGIWGSPIQLSAHADRVTMIVQSGRCNGVHTSKPGCTYSSGPGGNLRPMVAVRAPMALGAWHQLVLHFRWATDSSGVVEVWHRKKGDSTWHKTVSLRGYPTVQWTSDKGPEEIASSQTADKIGGYRAEADFPLTVWHDGFVRASSFAAAAAALP
jgi:Polysaccharide lyase